VVHTHQIGPLLYTGPAARSLRVPLLVHTEHGKANYTRLKTRWLGRLGALFVDRFYCLSEDMAAWVKAHRVVNTRKLAVIANGIDTACYTEECDADAVRRELGIPAGAPVVGTVGRLHEVKRQDVLLRAFKRVRERVPGAHLLLVGDGPLREELATRSGQLGLSGYVHFAGYQQHTTPYLRTMTCFALPSRSEGMPQSLLEACVAGVPVVASRVGGIPEVIEHGRTGLLVESGDEGALADGLVELLGSTERSRALSEAARAKVLARFDIGRMAGDYHRDFLELLGRKTRWKRARVSRVN
jgi:glycosyltransferase involved in cell wall biosynthesis